jgi:predicted secreted protein
MKMKKSILIVLVLAMVLLSEQAKADFTFSESQNLKSVIPVVDATYEYVSCLSYDGLEIYIDSTRPEGLGDWDIWVLKRASKNDDWDPPENLGSGVNSPGLDCEASISADGLTLYFCSNRTGGYGDVDLYMTTRTTKNDNWGPPINLGANINSSHADSEPWITANGLELYFQSFNRAGGYGVCDFWVTKRATQNEPWDEAVNLGPVVNAASWDIYPCVSADGLLLFFSGSETGPYRPGGYGGSDMWLTRRASLSDQWQAPINLGPKVNSTANDIAPRISPDGLELYFYTERDGTYDNWKASIIPIVDLNGDSIVDAADMCIVVDNWGTDNKLCDIGPTPFGDGVVDVQDLIILAEHLFEVYPSAETVDVSEADNVGQVEVELGKLLVVTLESNPSTGYKWELIENNDSILKQFGQTEYKPAETSEQQIVGAGGWEIFRFKAVSAGQMTLELVYHRSWEDTEPLKTFSIQVTVN